MNFKAGDKIMCIDIKDLHYFYKDENPLTLYKIYTVLSDAMIGSCVYITDNNNKRFAYYCVRFKKVNDLSLQYINIL